MVTTRTRPLLTLPLAAALLALAGAAPGQSPASPPRTPEVEAALRQAKGLSAAFNYASRTISPSVVHITQLARVQQMRSWFDPPETVLRQVGAGSGVVMSADGYILTNHHVIEGAEQVRVKFSDGREADGKIVGSDPATDLGVVKVDAPNLTPASWGDSERLDVGEWVLAVGSPFGEFDNTVTAGIVSAKNRTNLQGLSQERYEDFIQTDAAINPGNSGGPLVNLEGQVVGINSQIATRGVAQSAGIGFSIPESIAKPVMESIIRTGRAQRGWAGVAPKADPAGAELREGGGVVLGTVIRGGPAERAGLRPGDVVVRVNGRAVENWNRLRNAIAFSTPGSKVDVEVLRGGSPTTLTLTVADRADALATVEGGRAFKDYGFTVQTIDENAKRELRLPANLEGVVITQLDALGPAAQAGLQVGDVIALINRRPTPDATQFDRLVDDLGRDRLRVGVYRPTTGQRGSVELLPRRTTRE